MQKEISCFYLKSLSLAVLATFLFSTLGGLVSIFSGRENHLAPWSFASFWCLLAIFATSWAVKKLNVFVPHFFLVSMCSPIFVIFPLLFLSSAVDLSPLMLAMETRYVGISTGDYSDPESYFTKEQLHCEGSEEVKIIKELKSNNYAFTYFYFWQTGLAHGYLPSSEITEYIGAKTLHDRLLLYFTIGPVLIAEKFIFYLNMLPLYVIFQAGYFWLCKKHIWWEVPTET